jgi:hypothetical protein
LFTDSGWPFRDRGEPLFQGIRKKDVPMQNENSVTPQPKWGETVARIVRFAAFVAVAVFLVVRVLTAQGEAGDSLLMTVMCVLTGVVMVLTGITSLSSAAD